MNELPQIRNNRNSRVFRHRLVERYRMGMYTPFRIWQLYGVNRTLLHRWNCQYYRFRLLPRKKSVLMKPKKMSEKALIAYLEKRIKELEAAYSQERLSRELYEKMIEIAEQEFEIPIRKKYGAKLLHKQDETTRS